MPTFRIGREAFAVGNTASMGCFRSADRGSRAGGKVTPLRDLEGSALTSGLRDEAAQVFLAWTTADDRCC
jgi:hypothetical protein